MSDSHRRGSSIMREVIQLYHVAVNRYHMLYLKPVRRTALAVPRLLTSHLDTRATGRARSRARIFSGVFPLVFKESVA